MNNVTPIPVRLEAFEGPLDLLLHLIDKNKINIYDIPVSEITDQYLDYVQQMKEEKLEVASEFLVMAATLLDIKSRMLLPREEKEDEEEEGDPREELVQRLLDYKLTKYQSEELKDKSLEASRNVFRKQDLPREVRDYQPPVDYDELLGETTLKNLTKIFEDVLKRQKNRMDPVRSTFGRIRKEEVSIEARTEELQEFFKTHSRTSFRALLEGSKTRQSLIVTFLILLDFIKSGVVHVSQSDIFGEIEIFAGALPVGGMGPQETMPSNRAEARALRKAQKQKEKQAASERPADKKGEEEEADIPEAELSSVTEERTVPETVSSHQHRVILSQPGQGGRGKDQLKGAEVYIVTRVSEKKDEVENDSLLNNIEEIPLEEPAEEEAVSEEENPDAASYVPGVTETEENDQRGPAEEEVLTGTGIAAGEAAEEAYEEDPEEDGESEESGESDVYRLIRSKDWETVLDEYMEDEGLAELLEEEKTEESPDPEQDGDEDTDVSPADDSEETGDMEKAEPSSEEQPKAETESPGALCGKERLSESEAGPVRPAEEAGGEEKEVSACGEGDFSEEEHMQAELPEAEELSPGDDEGEAFSGPSMEETLDREPFEEQDTAVKTSACAGAPEGPIPQGSASREYIRTAGEAGRNMEEIQESALPAVMPESQTEDLSEGPVEEEWKKARYLQPSRLYFSPWADRWRSPRSHRPSKSRSRKPGRQWKRSERSLVMRAAACRSIAMTTLCSSPPERNTTNI